MKFRWEFSEPQGLSLFDQIKKNRNLTSDFFVATADSLPSPELLKDLNKAAFRLIQALQKKEKILIFGHDDMDGITATYILFDFLGKIGSQEHYYYIPNRLLEDHGLQKAVIERIKKEKFSLLVTVDGGITASREIAQINSLGCDVIVTDHHLLQGPLPPAMAIINPKQPDCSYPDKMIAGVTISYFLVWKLASLLGIKPDGNYLFWVAVGSISDKVPMLGVNRILVKQVLEEWADSDDSNLHMLHDFFLIPHHYASRMALIKNIIKLMSHSREKRGENKALRFLLAKGEIKYKLLQELEANYVIQEEKLKSLLNVTRQIESSIDSCYLLHFDKHNQLPSEYLGMAAGIIAHSKLVPVLLLQVREGILKCEARCTEGFNLMEAFQYCQDHLIQFGGHRKAAGFTMKQEDLYGFKSCLGEYMAARKEKIDQERVIRIDAVLDADQAWLLEQFIQQEFTILQPFGEGNPSPVIMLRNFSDYEKQADSLQLERDSLPPLPGCYDLLLQYNNSGWKTIDYQ